MSVGGNRRLVPLDRKPLLAANADLCARIAPEKREREREKERERDAKITVITLSLLPQFSTI